MKTNNGERVRKIGRTVSTHTETVKIKAESGGLGVLKTLIMLAIIAIQLAIFVYLNITFALAFKWLLALSFVLSLITCIYVLSSNKNSLSKAVWIIFILIFFTLGYIFYLISDERIFFRKAKIRYKNIYDNSKSYVGEKNVYSESSVVERDCTYLYQAGNFNVYKDTAAEYFPSGAQLFDNLLDRLKKAEKFIFIEYFIVSDGNLLNRFFDVLSECVSRGVDVRLIYDDMGSHKPLSHKNKVRFKKAGIKLCAFNRLVPIISVALNYRDHRKIVVIDGKTAYTGGCNLADEYVNEKRMHGYWKDNGIRLDGPAVDGFTLIFLRQWEYLTKTREDYSSFMGMATPSENSAVVVPYADGLDFELPIGKSVYENMIAAAKDKIYIMTPYFIVDDAITNLLINKALSGVDVRIILPEIPDKSFVYGVTRNNAEKLMDYGVKAYLMKNSFVHSKLLLTENSVVVGSINMDLRSFYQQFECAVYTDDHKIRSAVLSDFENTFNDCQLITEKNKLRKHTFYRAFAGLMQVFAPFM